MASVQRTNRRRLKSLAIIALGVALAALGVYNLVLKATWTLMDDGVFWKAGPEGVVAHRVAAGGPAARAGVQPGDVLLAIDGEETLRPGQVEEALRRQPGGPATYSLLRLGERRGLEVRVRPLAQGNVALFCYLSLVGFFSLAVGTIVMLRRPAERATLHFYAICVLFFLVYSTSYTGSLDAGDWVLFWTDHLAVLFLPVVFLHFCMSFPERRLPGLRPWLIPAIYMPALALAGAALTSHALAASGGDIANLWRIADAIDRGKPLYFAALFAVSFGVLLDSYRRTRALTARRQMKWLVWGTGAGVLPFLAFYAIPFALGQEPRLAMELAGYIPLALLPLSLAYAVVKHRLMDVELIFRRTLAYTLAVAAILGISLLTIGLTNVLLADEEPHTTIIALLSTLVVILLFTPVKSRIQDGIDRLFYRERYRERRALLRLSQDMNSDLEDLGQMSGRLIEGVGSALGLSAVAVFLPGDDGAFRIFRSRGCPEGTESVRLPARGRLITRLSEGQPVNAETSTETFPEAGPLNLTCYFPCRVKGEVIAVLGVGRKDDLDPLNSEEVDTLQTLAAQAATAILNGRLFHSLRQKADELRGLTEYNENILESIDSGMLVLDLEGEIVRWNRAMEALYGRSREEVIGQRLDDILPPSFLEALRGSLVLGDREEIAHIYKLHLPTRDGRSLMVNVSVAPFEIGSGERCGTVLILEDITARVRLEEQLQHSEKMASIGILAAGVAHEVNTPLAGISSYTQLLKGQIDEMDPRASLLDKIEKQSFRAAKIINNLLNFSRAAGAEMECLDVNKALLDVLSLIEHQLDGSKIRVRRELSARLPSVRGNENRIQQVFFNLILNARDAMPRGGWLTIKTSADDDTVVAEVCDTGVGIKREDIKRIYDPFFTTKGIGRGTGLGLSVSYGIVQEHGGAIFVDSVPGKGTTFQVALPAFVQAAEAAGEVR